MDAKNGIQSKEQTRIISRMTRGMLGLVTFLAGLAAILAFLGISLHVVIPVPTPTPTATSITVVQCPTGHFCETSGGEVHTWTNYMNAGGTEGPTIPTQTTVEVSCRVQGFKVSDGNTWWYRIAQIPWSNNFYGSADAFYNKTGVDSLPEGPFVDSNVPLC